MPSKFSTARISNLLYSKCLPFFIIYMSIYKPVIQCYYLLLLISCGRTYSKTASSCFSTSIFNSSRIRLLKSFVKISSLWCKILTYKNVHQYTHCCLIYLLILKLWKWEECANTPCFHTYEVKMCGKSIYLNISEIIWKCII